MLNNVFKRALWGGGEQKEKKEEKISMGGILGHQKGNIKCYMYSDVILFDIFVARDLIALNTLSGSVNYM